MEGTLLILFLYFFSTIFYLSTNFSSIISSSGRISFTTSFSWRRHSTSQEKKKCKWLWCYSKIFAWWSFFYQFNYMLIHILFFIVVFFCVCLCFFFCLFEIMNECLAFSELVKPWLGWCVVFLPSECLSPSRSKDGYKENS